MTEGDTDVGVMDQDYGTKRRSNRPLIYRYKTRASMAVRGYQQLASHSGEPRVLELGAADGNTLLEMRDALGPDGSYVGVELSEELLEQAPDLPERSRILRGDVMSLPDELEPGSFHLCNALAVLEHLPRPEQCVKEAYRMLTPGGVFVASCPSPFWDQLAGALGLVADDFHQQDVTMSDMALWARDAGFESVETRPFMWSATGVLPYLGISPDPERTLDIDSVVRRVDRTKLSFVNQALLARK